MRYNPSHLLTGIALFKKYCSLLLVFLSVFSPAHAAQKKHIALTIDDLPFVGESQNFHLNQIIETIKTQEIPVTGFVIAGEVNPRNWPMLEKFRDAGFGLGNHTLTHKNLNQVNAETYLQEIETADKILSPILTEPKFFRYPYLAMSGGDKKNRVMDFLTEKNYQIAPITIDSRDFLFNQLLLAVPENERRDFLKVLAPCYINFIWKQTLKAQEMHRENPKRAQILLIHANLLNAYVLPDIINLYKQNDYAFVSLSKALQSFAKAPKQIEQKIAAHHSFFAWD